MDARYKLIGTSGRFAGCEFGVGPGIHQIGRHSSNQVVLAGDGSVSRNHARLTVSSNGISLEDLKSTNGTYVNGKKITRQAVAESDTLRFGDASFTLRKSTGFSASIVRACPETGCPGRISPAGVCTACGKAPRPCPRCGTLNTADARFCQSDGTKLDEPAPGVPSPDGPLAPANATSNARIGAGRPGFNPVPAGGLPHGPVSRHEVSSRTTVTTPSTATGTPAASARGNMEAEAGRAGRMAPSVAERLSNRVLGQQDYPRCPQCSSNVGNQAELCPRCHCRVRRCAGGHISPATARVCVRCGQPLLPVAERWGVFRGAGSSGWTPEAVRPPLRLAWKFRPPEGPVGWTSPVLGRGAAYVGASDGFLYALQGGIALWRTPLDGRVRTDPVPETCVPAYADDRVFIGHMGNAIAAVNAEDGVLLWQAELPGRPSSPPRAALDHLFVGVYGMGDGAVCALTMDGRIAWSHPTDGPVYSCPAYSAGAILVTTATGGVLALEASSGRLLWQHVERGDECETSLAVVRDGVYATTKAGKLLCLDPRTGEVRRRWTSPTGNYAHSSPAAGSGATDGMVFFGADDRTIYVVSTATARTIASHATGGVVLGSPAVSDDLAYVGSQDGTLYVIGPTANRIEPAYKMTDGLHISSSPAIGDGRIVFAGSDGFMYALETASRA